VDQLSEFLFGQPRHLEFRNSTQRLELQYFLEQESDRILNIPGRNLNNQDLFDLTGMPNGSLVTACLFSSQPDQISFHFEARHEDLNITRIQELVLLNETPGIGIDEMILQDRGRGLGTRIFAHQAHRAADIGFQSIALFAARGQTMNGYLTWPKLGFDGPLEDQLNRIATAYASRTGSRLPDDVQTVQELLSLEFGVETWIDLGEGMAMEFDLSPGSPSWVFLNLYLQQKDIVLAERW
jgi:hypothetical protein